METAIEKFDVWEAIRWNSRDAIPAAKVLICWKYEIGSGIVDLLVTDFPNDEQYLNEYWRYTYGACFPDWLNPNNRTMTPESVFGEMTAAYGFANPAVAEKAIVMFARIEECEWARKMVATDSYENLVKAKLTAHL